jgi:predicted esterase
MSPSAPPSGPSTAPRILCLHGGGTNASIFRFQLRSILSRSSPNFRFVFVEAPFISAAHPAVAEIFAEFAPFRRWLRWSADHPPIDDDEAAERIVDSCREAMREDDKLATGEWVGLLGFSQGAKMAASLLWAQQVIGMKEKPGKPLLDAKFKFGVLMAGRFPTVVLSTDLPHNPHTSPAGRLSMDPVQLPASDEGEHAVMIPTLHVHGLADPGLEQHRQMRELWFAKGTTKLVEWEGDHRLPVKPADVDRVLEKMYELAEDAGVEIMSRDLTL